MADVPLAARMRPRTPAEFVGQTHLVGPGRALTKLIEKGALPSLILWGPLDPARPRSRICWPTRWVLI